MTSRQAGDGDAPELSFEEQVEKARNIVTRQLALPRTRHQLAEALRTRGISEEAGEVILDRFEELGLIDDRDYARMFVASKTAHGKDRISYELLRKGVAREIVEEAVNTVSDEDEFASALALARKKLRAAQGNPLTLRQRTWASVARRGFSPDIVSRAVAQAWEETRGEPIS